MHTEFLDLLKYRWWICGNTTVMNADEVRVLKKVANGYCDQLAWPTVLLVTTTFSLFFLIPALVFSGHLPIWLGTVGMAFVTYANYTALHEAVHGSICGARQQFRWLNELVGHLAAILMGTPFVAHRHEHFLHHNHTNMGEKDPDIFCANMTQSPWHAFLAAWKLTASNYRVFLQDRWPVVDVRQRVIFVAEIIGIVLARVILLAMPFGLVGPVASSDPIWLTSATLLVLVIGPVVGIVVLIYLFAYLVHVPHEVQGKFIDTSVYEPPAAVRSLITWLWGFQNYHGIHHAFPRVPWYRYRALFEAEKEAILRQGMPTHHLSGYRWQRVN